MEERTLGERFERMYKVREGFGRLLNLERSQQSLLRLAGMAWNLDKYTQLGDRYIAVNQAIVDAGGESVPPLTMMFDIAWDDQIDDQREIEQHAKEAIDSGDPVTKGMFCRRVLRRLVRIEEARIAAMESLNAISRGGSDDLDAAAVVFDVEAVRQTAAKYRAKELEFTERLKPLD